MARRYRGCCRGVAAAQPGRPIVPPMPIARLSDVLRSPWLLLALALLALAAVAILIVLLAPDTTPAGGGPWSQVRMGR
jgi:hypothetical protein